MKNKTVVEWSIVICTYKRKERLFVCLNCLISSIYRFNKNVQLVILDNAPKSTLKRSLSLFFETKKIINYKYINDPNSNLSQLRNKSLKYICPSTQYILFLDSDIYLAKDTIQICTEFLRRNKNIDALSPPLLSYTGGRHSFVREQHKKYLNSGSKDFTMPNSQDYASNKRQGSLLKTHMLRGAFIIKRIVLLQNFGLNPWLKIFRVWQNVPFFLTLSEINIQFGYLLDEDIIALHDERAHPATIRASMKNWKIETLKSIILIFFRNQLWTKTLKKRNQRFIQTIKKVVGDLGVNSENFDYLFDIAKVLSVDRAKLRTELNHLKLVIPEYDLKATIDLLIGSDINDIKKVESRDLNNII